jgi:hypothetical protein
MIAMAAKLTPEEWKKVGELYVANIPVLRISKQFGVARISIGEPPSATDG